MDLISESTLKVQESSVSDKIDADICPLCLDVFYTTQELLKHVLETYHISSDSSCSKPYEKSNCDSCHLCPNSDFKDPSDLLKHFFEKHKVSSQPTCDEKEEISVDTHLPLSNIPSELSIKSELIEPSEILETKVKVEDLNVKIEETFGTFQWEENNLAHDAIKIESNEAVPEDTFESNDISEKTELLPKDELSKEKKTKCPFCSEEIPSRTKLRNHLKRKHKKNKNVPKCKVCKKVFATTHALEDHLHDKHGQPLPKIDLPKPVPTKILPYQCKLCNKSFKLPIGLASHQKCNHDSKCKYCELIFTCEGRLQVHMNTTHHEELLKASSKEKDETELSKSKEELQLQEHPKFKCAKCELYFSETSDGRAKFQDHVRTHHSSFTIRCDFCDIQFKSRVEHKFHVSQNHSIKCPDCSWFGHNEASLEKHQKLKHNFLCPQHHCNNLRFKSYNDLKHHLKEQVCEFCKIHFNSDEDLSEHHNSCPNKVKQFKCSKCDWIGITLRGLQDHVTQKHSFKCPECPWFGYSQTGLQKHQQDTHRFKCSKCDTFFDLSDQGRVLFKEHMKLKHTYKCDICNIDFHSLEDRYSHNQLNHKFPCSCDLQFDDILELQVHMKEQVCDQCNLHFASKKELKIHKKNIHLKHCEYCNSYFPIDSNLTKHQKKCSYRFTCKTCNIDLLSLIALQAHNEEKHNKKTVVKAVFKCELCNEKCGSSISLKYHKQFIHPNQTIQSPMKRSSEENPSISSPLPKVPKSLPPK